MGVLRDRFGLGEAERDQARRLPRIVALVLAPAEATSSALLGIALDAQCLRTISKASGRSGDEIGEKESGPERAERGVWERPGEEVGSRIPRLEEDARGGEDGAKSVGCDACCRRDGRRGRVGDPDMAAVPVSAAGSTGVTSC